MEERMTLTERLRNPQWVHGGGLPEAMLDTQQTVPDMREAADALDGESVCRKSLVNEIRRLSDALSEANEVLRSAYQIAARRGGD